MKSVLAGIAALAFMSASAVACPLMKTAEHHTMSVASLEATDVPMSTASDAAMDEAAVDEVTTGAIEPGAEDAE